MSAGDPRDPVAGAPLDLVDALRIAPVHADRMANPRRRIPEEQRRAGEEADVVVAVDAGVLAALERHVADPRVVRADLEHVHLVHAVELGVRAAEVRVHHPRRPERPEGELDGLSDVEVDRGLRRFAGGRRGRRGPRRPPRRGGRASRRRTTRCSSRSSSSRSAIPQRSSSSATAPGRPRARRTPVPGESSARLPPAVRRRVPRLSTQMLWDRSPRLTIDRSATGA